jgi:hypothetical protein
LSDAFCRIIRLFVQPARVFLLGASPIRSMDYLMGLGASVRLLDSCSLKEGSMRVGSLLASFLRNQSADWLLRTLLQNEYVFTYIW